MKIVVLGLSVTSSWGNGHATTYRALLRELGAAGHDILFLERDQPWYAENRDLPVPGFCDALIYRSVAELKRQFTEEIRDADCVVIGSYVPEGIAVAEWVTTMANGVTAFYDIDTPVTLAKLAGSCCTYISPALIPRFDLYFSFTGGPTLTTLERVYKARRACALYCSVDAGCYFPEKRKKRWALGYLGTYSADRQPSLERLLTRVATELADSFIVAGPQYPASIRWPSNVKRIQHLEPSMHREFYNAQRFTLNVTRAEMVRAGWSPSVRLFEAAACATPVISDPWPGLEEFFEPGREILVASTTEEVVRILRDVTEGERQAIGSRARDCVLAEHTAAHRAQQFVDLVTNTGSCGASPLTKLQGATS